jgi:hypothetical protein
VAKKSKADARTSGKVSKAKARSTSSKSKKPTVSKKRAAEKRVSEAAPVYATALDPTSDQISMRAYFLSERRRRFDLPGDANSDWLEAKRQLLAETRH